MAAVQAPEGGQEWREGSVGIVFVRPPRRRMPFAARLSALLAVALVRSRSAEVPSGAMPEATARTGVEIRLGFPAGARVNEAELRGTPPARTRRRRVSDPASRNAVLQPAHAPPATPHPLLPARLPAESHPPRVRKHTDASCVGRGGACSRGCWLQAVTEPGRDAAEGLSPALDTGLLVSLAQASTVVSPNTSAAADFGIVSVWSVMTHPAPAAGGGRADDSAAGDGGAATAGGLTPSADMDECEGRDNGDRESRAGEQCGGWQAAHVELEVPYWGASHPYLEGVHHIDVKLLSPARRHSLARGANISWLSVYPDEQEILFPPLSYLRPTGRECSLDLPCTVLPWVTPSKPTPASPQPRSMRDQTRLQNSKLSRPADMFRAHFRIIEVEPTIP